MKSTGSTTGKVSKPSLDVQPVSGEQIGQKGQAGTEESPHNGTNGGKS